MHDEIPLSVRRDPPEAMLRYMNAQKQTWFGRKRAEWAALRVDYSWFQTLLLIGLF